jgi:hypothetical protein
MTAANGNNETARKTSNAVWFCFRFFRYFPLFRHLSSCLVDRVLVRHDYARPGALKQLIG